MKFSGFNYRYVGEIAFGEACSTCNGNDFRAGPYHRSIMCMVCGTYGRTPFVKHEKSLEPLQLPENALYKSMDRPQG